MYSAKEIVVENAAELAAHNQHEFCLIRRQGFGASDASTVLGVNKWNKIEDVLVQKQSSEVTEEELKVGQKPQVRMGNDLEPLILEKFKEWAGTDKIEKPEAMYRLTKYPWLTINYDGLWLDTPVEIKTVSMFASKYWDWDKALDSPSSTKPNAPYIGTTDPAMRLEVLSAHYGVPDYYITQVQQQLLGTEANGAYLVALDVKNWEVRVFWIWEDEELQRKIIERSYEYANQIGLV